jgi:ribosomal protein L40E
MEHQAVGKVRVELHQKVMAAKICPECGTYNAWDATECDCGAGLPEGETVKEDRGLIAASDYTLRKE